MEGTVASVHRSATHDFTKGAVDVVELVAGLGVTGDAHAGASDQHVSRKSKEPPPPNLRQVHLITAELHRELRAAGFDIEHGCFGENLVTSGLPLGEFPVGTTLAVGDDAVLVLTGFRDPCAQIDRHRPGLRAAVTFDPGEGPKLFRDGVMAVVVRGGAVRSGDPIRVALPAQPHHPMRKV